MFEKSIWQKVFVRSIATESKIIDEHADANKKIRVRLNVKGVEKRPLMNEKEGATKYYKRTTGQFIYGRQNFHKGAFGIVPQELNGFSSSGDLPAFDIDDSCLPEWLFYSFKVNNRYVQMSKHAKGIGSQRVSSVDFLNQEIFLPSLEVQRKVLNQVHTLKQASDGLNIEFLTQQKHLKQLRQAILQEAIEGKLTVQWRAENPVVKGDLNTDAQALLTQIHAEKQSLIAQGKLKKDKPLAPITDDEKPFELPEGWVWVRLGEVCNKITDGFHNTPKKLEQTDFVYISATHVKDCIIDWANCDFVDEVNHKELFHKAYPQKGEILIVNIGAGCGVSAIIDVEYEFSFKNVAVLKFNQVFLINHFLQIYLRSQRDRIYLNLTQGGLQPFLSLKTLKDIFFLLPPIAEQSAIVTKVQHLLAQVDALETELKTRQQHAEQLMQSVLREAFHPTHGGEI